MSDAASFVEKMRKFFEKKLEGSPKDENGDPTLGVVIILFDKTTQELIVEANSSRPASILTMLGLAADSILGPPKKNGRVN